MDLKGQTVKIKSRKGKHSPHSSFKITTGKNSPFKAVEVRYYIGGDLT